MSNSINDLAVGITVSKKIGKAVVRNKVKRRIKAFLRDNSLSGITSYLLLNIIALPAVVKVGWTEICRDLEVCVNRLAKGLRQEA
jgi:ribonuclease P protein component